MLALVLAKAAPVLSFAVILISSGRVLAMIALLLRILLALLLIPVALFLFYMAVSGYPPAVRIFTLIFVGAVAVAWLTPTKVKPPA